MNKDNSKKSTTQNTLSLLGNRIIQAGLAGLVSGLIGEIAEATENSNFLDNNDECDTSADDDNKSIIIQNNIELEIQNNIDLENDLDCF